MHGEAPAMEAIAQRLTEGGIAAAYQVIMLVLDERWTLPRGARPRRQDTKGHRADPARSMRPDWHNQRAGLLLAIESATEKARDDAAREALLHKLRAVLQEGYALSLARCALISANSARIPATPGPHRSTSLGYSAKSSIMPKPPAWPGHQIPYG